jgi:rhodanese-related sulfurtransferase
LGRIKDAKHIHVEELGSRIKELAEYKNKEIIVYCLVGIRSARASEYLAENGFTKVNNMLGGMELWNQSRDETVKCKNTLLDR